jgi:hypothetical protein
LLFHFFLHFFLQFFPRLCLLPILLPEHRACVPDHRALVLPRLRKASGRVLLWIAWVFMDIHFRLLFNQILGIQAFPIEAKSISKTPISFKKFIECPRVMRFLG